MGIARKDVFQASKILVDFLRDFTALTEKQLLSVRHLMEAIVGEVMDSINKMNSEASVHKDKANEILVLGEGGKQFVSSSATNIEQKELNGVLGGKQDHKGVLENRLLRDTGVFSKHLEAVSQLDSDLQALIVKVMGSVSADDVIAQRLGHVVNSIHVLHQSLANFLLDYEKQCTPEGVKHLRNRVLTEVYLSYTAEDEREIFHKVFGQPRDSKKVS